MTETESNVQPVPTTNPQSFEAYERLLPEIQAFPNEALVAINIDPLNVVTTIQGSLPEMRALRDQIVEELVKFDIERFDKLQEYTHALTHAQVLYRAATAPPRPVTELAAELTTLRDKFLSSALNLAEYGLVDETPLRQCRTAVGYKALASDVLVLRQILQSRWEQIQGKTPLQRAELDQSSLMAEELLLAIGLREQSPSVVAEVAAIRQKAYSLVVTAYEDARRAIGYLRLSKGDADQIAPSLYAGRGGTGRRKSDPVPAEATTPAPAPVATPAATIPAALLAAPLNSTLPITSPFQA